MCSDAHGGNGRGLQCECPASNWQADSIGTRGPHQAVQGVENARSRLLGNSDLDRPLGVFQAHRSQILLLVCLHASL